MFVTIALRSDLVFTLLLATVTAVLYVKRLTELVLLSAVPRKWSMLVFGNLQQFEKQGCM